MKTIPEPSPPKHARGKAQINAWLARNNAAMQNAIDSCNRRYGNGTLGYGRAYGYGYGSTALPSAIANMTGEPVDVVIN